MGAAATATVRGRGVPDWLDRIPATGLGDDPRRALQERILPAYLSRCRWYPAKDAGAPTVAIDEVLDCPEPIGDGAALAILGVTPPGQQMSRYALPLTLAQGGEDGLPDDAIARFAANGRPAALIDGFESDRVVAGMLEALLRATAGAAQDGPFLFRQTDALDRHRAALPAARPTRSGAEQSNTSIRFGGVAILKLFRRLEGGIHPELEVARFLTEAGYANTPPLLGWIELRPSQGVSAVLAVLQELVRDAADGWSLVLRRLRAHAERGSAATFEQPPLLGLAQRLGRRTAELHLAFARPSGDSAFAPEPVTPARLAAWAESARRMAADAMQALQQGTESLPPATRRQAQALLARRDELFELVAGLPPADTTGVCTRLHGDFHLGQVLVTDEEDVFIIDFEGEPMRPLAERRAKHSPLRDVAGMLRSFAYAAAAAAAAAASARTEPAADAEIGWLDRWAEAMSAAFLDAYRARAGGCPSLPDDPAHGERLLQLFLLEKALYELRYELANRPAWLPIPLTGILALLDRRRPGATT